MSTASSPLVSPPAPPSSTTRTATTTMPKERKPKRTRPRKPVDPTHRTEANWTYLGIPELAQAIEKVTQVGSDYRIITKETASCDICDKDFSKGKVKAPNGYLNHTRRGLKCQRLLKLGGLKLFALKRTGSNGTVRHRTSARRTTRLGRNTESWESVKTLEDLDPEQYPQKEEWLSRVMPITLGGGDGDVDDEDEVAEDGEDFASSDSATASPVSQSLSPGNVASPNRDFIALGQPPPICRDNKPIAPSRPVQAPLPASPSVKILVQNQLTTLSTHPQHISPPNSGASCASGSGWVESGIEPRSAYQAGSSSQVPAQAMPSYHPYIPQQPAPQMLPLTRTYSAPVAPVYHHHEHTAPDPSHVEAFWRGVNPDAIRLEQQPSPVDLVVADAAVQSTRSFEFLSRMKDMALGSPTVGTYGAYGYRPLDGSTMAWSAPATVSEMLPPPTLPMYGTSTYPYYGSWRQPQHQPYLPPLASSAPSSSSSLAMWNGGPAQQQETCGRGGGGTGAGGGPSERGIIVPPPPSPTDLEVNMLGNWRGSTLAAARMERYPPHGW